MVLHLFTFHQVLLVVLGLEEVEDVEVQDVDDVEDVDDDVGMGYIGKN